MRFLILLPLFLFNICFSQDTVRIKHTNFTTVYSKSKKYPVLVQWVVTKKMVTCEFPLKRKDNFKPDPKLPEFTDLLDDYVGSGYDRGHMMPAADNLCQTQQVQDECFYFSNMSAQFHSLNAGDWKSLETFVREKAKTQDSIFVWAGNLGESKKIGSVSVPTQCWKVVYVKKENLWGYFIFNNDKSKPDGFENNKVSKDLIEKRTGFKFRTN